jgi:hypothetical protein
MASLQETKHRIESIKVTRKTTKAMQLVATVKLRQSMKNLDKIKEYYYSVYETFQNLFTQTRDLSQLFPSDAKPGTLFIVITLSPGLYSVLNNLEILLIYPPHNPMLEVITINRVPGFASEGNNCDKSLVCVNKF